MPPSAWHRTDGCMSLSLLSLHSSIYLRDRFHASRYPAKPADVSHKFDPKTHNHVIFIRKNKFFKVPLATPHGVELSAAELEVYVRGSPTFTCNSTDPPRSGKLKEFTVLQDKTKLYPSAR